MFFGGKASCLFFFLLKIFQQKSQPPSTFQQSSWKRWSKDLVRKKHRSFHKLRNLNLSKLETVPFFKKEFHEWNGSVLKLFLSKPFFFGGEKKSHASNVVFIFFLWGSRVLFETDIIYQTRPFVEILTTSNSSTECTIAGAAPRARRPLAIKSILTSAHQLHIGTTQLCNKKNNTPPRHIIGEALH